MYSAIIPYLMDGIAFAMIILCLVAGQSRHFIPELALMSLNATDFRSNYTATYGMDLPIHDVYNVYMTTHCEGYYVNGARSISSFTCSKPSSNGTLAT